MRRNQERKRTAADRPVGLFVFVQMMGVCAMALSAGLMVAAGMLLLNGYRLREAPAGGALWLLGLLGTGGCLLWLLTEFVLMCGRVRKETAFTAANVRALGRMALAFLLGGVLLLPAAPTLMDALLLGLRNMSSPLWWSLPSFTAWAAALMVRAIQVLMRRAVELQTETDLTI